MSKTILILGSSYAGLTVAHTLLKKTFTAVHDYQVIMVSPTTDFYYCTAAVRAIVPGQFPDEKVFMEIAPGFANYPKGSFQHIIGTATALDTSANSVTITTSDGEQKLPYEILVLATGSRYISDAVPWKNSALGSAATKTELHRIQEKVKAAKTIVIGGGGPTGVETAAELAFEYPKLKDVTLISSGDELLIGSLPTKIAQGAEKQIVSMGVKVVKGTRITASSLLSTGQTELTLSNGQTQLCDLYLPTIGVVPNTDYVPQDLLNDKGEVVVDPCLRVKNTTNIWAAGDVVDIEPTQFVYADKQATALSKNLDLVLRGKDPVAYKYGGDRILGLSLGRSKGTGAKGTTKLPSLAIWWVKGRTLGTQNLRPYVMGTKF